MPLLPPTQMNLNGGANNESGYGTSSMVIKARLGGDVRKIAVHNSDMTHDELLLMMQRIFKGRISPADNVTLKYADEDGDLVTITDDSDLTFAMQTERVLKLTLFVNDQPQPLEADELKRIRQELVHIRDVSNKLLDSIAPKHSQPCANAERPVAAAAIAAPEVKKPPTINHMDGLETSREFDPLSHHHRSPAPNGPTRDSLPSTPVVHDIALNDKPPSVYGVGTHEASRPDTPNSQHSRRSNSVAEFGQQENVATIQPTVHQQMNAGQPPVHMGAPIFSSANPTPPAPPTTFDHQHQHQHQQQQQHAPQQQQHQHQYPAQPFGQQQPQPPGPTPPATAQSIFPPHSAPSLPPTSVPAPPASMGYGMPPAVGDPSNRPPQYGQHPPPPSGYPQHGHADGQSGQQQQQQQQPPQQQQQMPSYQHSPGYPHQQQQQQQQQQPQQQQHPAPPQAAQGMPPVGMPPMGPPVSFSAPGVNPFARGPSPGSNPYVRPSFPGGFQ
uniref:PB1 domain-containing protein n=1 Tax=Plectus sambesii TaxID=2011161 RepID=A0A914VMI2_9BILA